MRLVAKAIVLKAWRQIASGERWRASVSSTKPKLSNLCCASVPHAGENAHDSNPTGKATTLPSLAHLLSPTPCITDPYRYLTIASIGEDG
jgi:hypothetical protein